MSQLPSKQRLVFTITASLLMLAWLLPNHTLPWPTAYQEFVAFTACIILSISLAPSPGPKANATLLAFFALPTIPILQFTLGIIYFSGDAIAAAAYLCAFATMLLAGYNFGKRPYTSTYLLDLLAGAFLASALVSSLIATRQWLLISNSIWETDLAIGGRPYANLGQANMLATLVLLGLVSTLRFYSQHKISKITATLISLLLIITLALTQSRTPWLASVAIILFFKWKCAAENFRATTKTLAGWLLAYVTVAFALPQISKALLLSAATPLARASSLERLDLWKQFWHAALHAPLLGYGWNQASMAQISASLEVPTKIVSEYSHNLVIDLLIWNGLFPGALITLFISLWLVKLGIKAKAHNSIFALLFSGIILTHGMLEYPLAYAFYLIPLGILLGIAAAEIPTHKDYTIPPTIIIIGFFISSITLYTMFSEYRSIEKDHLLLRFEKSNIGTLRASKPAPDTLLISQLSGQIRLFRTPEGKNLTTSQLNEIKATAHRYPSPTTLYLYAAALTHNGHLQEASTQLKIIRNLYGEKTQEETIKLIEANSIKQ